MQTYATHRRFNPLFHFVAMPIFAVNLVLAGIHLGKQPSAVSAWLLILSFGLLLTLVLSRVQAVTVQDRVIRLEERLRLQAIAPELAAKFGELSRRQLVALRFASDAELPDMARRALAGEFADHRAIKRAVKDWRADHLRA